MSNIPLPGQIYRHFKGNLYQIVTLAEHSETGEKLVVYQALYGEFKVYARPLSMFFEKVDKEKYPGAGQPDAGQERRFEQEKDPAEALSRLSVEENPGRSEGSTPDGDRTSGPAAVLGNEVPDAAFVSEGCAPGAIPPAEDRAADMESVSGRETADEAAAAESRNVDEVTIKAMEEQEELNIDPLVMDFLDARTYRERLKILSALHPRITDDMINVMAIAVDVEIEDGDTEKRFEELRTCLMTFERYESKSSRLRQR